MSKLSKGILVCFEGIDGSGKSATATSVLAQLRNLGIPAISVDRNCTDGCPPFVAERLSILTQMLWKYPENLPIRSFGDRHLIHLLVSWFHCFDEWIIRPRIAISQVVLIDTWFHKYVARFTLKPTFSARALLSYFRDLTTPDRILFLSIDPRLAWLRKSKVRDTESDTVALNPNREYRFVEYQTNVHRELLAFAAQSHWCKLDSAHSLADVTSASVRAILGVISEQQGRKDASQALLR
jgi:thymidylate kinase